MTTMVRRTRFDITLYVHS